MYGEKENCWCIKVEDLPEALRPVDQFKDIRLKDFIQGIENKTRFIDRDITYKDETLKRLIPYVIVMTEKTDLIATYERTGDHPNTGLLSFGIGGHVNEKDNVVRDTTRGLDENILINGMHRELNEELIQQGNLQMHFWGVVNCSKGLPCTTALGIVFVAFTKNPDSFVAGDELSDFKFVNISDLSDMSLEPWSQLLSSHLLNKG